ncbi:hypothetical protein ABHQ57_06860 [Tenacibaculum sp. ZH5_bin.1]|uniref:hypothetical protein n=1 Tax=unclassified Tenacibaculum TaxID=2635139 RepID=UPI0036EFCFBA
MIKVNPFTGQREFITPVVIKSISSTVNKLNNEKETPWQKATAEITYPSGEKQIIDVTLFTATLKSNPELFAVGQTVDAAIQIEGEHAGKGKLQLPALEVADVEALLTGTRKPNTVKEIKKIELPDIKQSISSDSRRDINQPKKVYIDTPIEKGCITTLLIVFCLFITSYALSGTVKLIGFLAYPLIGIIGLALAMFIWLLLFGDKK